MEENTTKESPDRTEYHAAFRQFAAAAEALAQAGEHLIKVSPPQEEDDDEVSLGNFALALRSLKRLTAPGFTQLFELAAAAGTKPGDR